MIEPTTYFGLLIEYGTTEIPLIKIAPKLGINSPEVANRKAAKNELPFKVYRIGDNKRPWLVDIKDFAEYLNKVKEKAQREFNETH